MSADQSAATAKAGKSFTAICLEFLGESASLSFGIAVVSEACAAENDRLVEHIDDLVAQHVCFVVGQGACGPGRIDSRAPERLIGVDVSDSRDSVLIHQDLLDRLI